MTLRLRAPSAERVELVSGGDIPGVPMQGGLPLAKGADGVFTVMLPALAAGAYRYRFTVDGVATNDPGNPQTSESNGNAWSLFYVPGAPFMDTQRVAHGSVAEVHYFSTALGRTRRMHVYTPPGYEKNRDTYPVFYLLHGAFDGDDSWSTVGRAGFIVDNLIAAGDARPMIVVMPDGHTSRFGGGGRRAQYGRLRPRVQRRHQAVRREHLPRPHRPRATRRSRGSRWAARKRSTSRSAISTSYGYVGVYSSGVFGIAEQLGLGERAPRAARRRRAEARPELVWFSTGKDDFLLDTTKATVAMLEKHGFDVVYEESAGGHTWINWREYLTKFAPQLFR